MKKVLFLGATSAIAVSVFGQSTPPDSKGQEPQMFGIESARGLATPGNACKGKDPYPNMQCWTFGNLTGTILPDVVLKSIFWGPRWGDPNFVGDKITGLDTFYSGFSNSNYAKTSDEYTGSNGQITPVLYYQGYVIDTSSTAPNDDSPTILAEICRQITAGNITPDPLGNGYYPVYLDVPKPSTSLHCAYHNGGTCGGVKVQYAAFWNLDGNRCGDPLDTLTGHSQGLATLANVSGHELSEARVNGAWRDSQNEENADKCGSPTGFNVPWIAFTDGTHWKIQGNWSNAAYTNGTGYANAHGQKGCIDGH